MTIGEILRQTQFDIYLLLQILYDTRILTLEQEEFPEDDWNFRYYKGIMEERRSVKL